MPTYSLMRGEYWIKEDGSIEFADGDIGENNHENVVISYIAPKWTSFFGVNEELRLWDEIVSEVTGYPDIPEDYEEVTERLVKEFLEQNSGLTLQQAMDEVYIMDGPSECFERLGVNIPRSADARDYAMEHWGWKAFRPQCYIESWTLTPNDIAIIADGVAEIYFEEHDEEIPSDYEFVLYPIAGTGKSRYLVTYKQLESGNITDAEDPDVKQATKNALKTLDKQDQDMMPGYYKGKMGDSLMTVGAFIVLCEKT